MLDLCKRAIHGVLVLSLIALVVGNALGQVPAPQFQSVYPSGGAPGSIVRVRTSGPNWVEMDQLIFSDPRLSAKVVALPREAMLVSPRVEFGSFDIAIAADQAPGIYEVWAAGRLGISNSRKFVVDRLPTLVDPGNNQSAASATAINLGQAINGRCDGANVDHYAITLNAGDYVRLQCLARSIDSRLTPWIQVISPSGKMIDQARGTEGKEAELALVAPEAGRYLITIKDYLLEGGENHFYWLRVDNQPLVSHVTPIVASASTPSIKLWGWAPKAEASADKGAMLGSLTVQPAQVIREVPFQAIQALRPWREEINVPSLSPAALTGDWYVLDGGEIHAMALPWSDLSTVEVEPTSDRIENAKELALPIDAYGSFPRTTQEVFVRFKAIKGQKLNLQVQSQVIGEESDPIVAVGRVTDSVQWIHTIDDPANREATRRAEYDMVSDDPSLVFDIPEDGMYIVRLRDQYTAQGTNRDSHYRLLIREVSPDFRLFMTARQPKRGGDQQSPLYAPNLARGTSVPIYLLLKRQPGFEGAVTVQPDKLPPGVTAAPCVIPAGKSDGWLVLTAANDAPYSLGEVRCTGVAQLGSGILTREAIPLVVALDSGDRNQNPAVFRLTSAMKFAVAPDSARLWIEAPTAGNGAPSTYSVAPGAELDLPIKIVRKEGFAAEVKLRVIGLPDNWQPPELTIAADQSEGVVKLKAPADSGGQGPWGIHLRTDVQIPHVLSPEAISRVEADRDYLAGRKLQTDQELERIKALGNATRVAQLEERLKQVVAKLAEVEKRLEETRKQQAPVNRDVALFSNGLLIQVTVPTP